MKTKSPKLSKETLIKIWQASRPNVYKNKKKYTRKNKYDKKIQLTIQYIFQKKKIKQINTLQMKYISDNITEEINDMFLAFENYENK